MLFRSAAHRAGDLFGKNVVIVGAGMIGLGVLACVVKAGATNIWVTDFSNERLQLAKQMGATRIINAAENPVPTIKKEAGYNGVDVAFECVGVGAALRTAMEVIRKGAKVIVMGVYGDEATIKAADLQDREMELIGTLMYTMRDVEEAIKLLADKAFPVEKIIAKVFPIEKAEEAFEYAREHKENIKTVIEVNKE